MVRRSSPKTLVGRELVRPHCSTILLLVVLTSLMVACGGGGSASSGVSNSGGTANTASLAWDPVTAANVSGYRIYYGTSTGSYDQPYGRGINVGNTTSATISGLSSGTRYYFAVTAFDASNNESGYSNEAVKDLP